MKKKKIRKLRIKDPAKQPYFSKQIFIWMAVFGAIGIITLIISHAATSFSTIEPEDGAANGATLVSDPSASGGRAVKFGQPATIGISNFLTGTTLVQYSLDSFGNAAAVAAGKTILNNSTVFGNQHLMGFGTVSPEPDPGVYSWTTQDGRFNTVLSGIDSKVLTACCSPDWMKGVPDFGTSPTGGNYIEVAPTPDHYEDYSDLVAATVARYPTIKYVQVWNEMKGFFSSTKNRWDWENYTTLYNLIWTKVKAVRPTVKIGGPYVVMDSYGGTNYFSSTTVTGPWGSIDKRSMGVITYWLQNKLGADFITIDGSNGNKDGVNPVSRYEMLDKFTAVTDWIRTLDNTTYPGAQTLPIWWAEWYANTEDSTNDSVAYKNAMMSAGMIKMVKSGVQTTLIWGTQGDTTGKGFPLSLFSDTRVAGGGIATPFAATQQDIHDNFSAGKTLIDNGNTNTNVDTLSTTLKTLLVNHTNASQSATILGSAVTLAPYEVKLISTP